MPVRLDPWQNIIGVSWGGALVLESVLANSNTLNLTSIAASFVSAQPGDLMIAGISSNWGSAQEPVTPAEIFGPAGWAKLYHRVGYSLPADFVMFTAGAWARVKQAGDPSFWTWTTDKAAILNAGRLRITGARQTGIPDAMAIDEAGPGEFAIGPSIAPAAGNTLLLTILDVVTATNLAGKYPGDPRQSLRLRHGTTGQTDGPGLPHGKIVWEEVWPGPGATGARDVSSYTIGSSILGHIAIAPR